MNRLSWCLKQLLPFQYVSTYTEDEQRKLSVFRMWFGRCFNVRTYSLAE